MRCSHTRTNADYSRNIKRKSNENENKKQKERETEKVRVASVSHRG